MSAYRRFFTRLKANAPRAFWRPARALATALFTPVRFGLATGHALSSLRNAAQAADGAPLPWYTYPAIDFLAPRRFDGCNVLEFGGGQSTLWWAQRAAFVMTIEEDEGWARRLRARVSANVDLRHVPIAPDSLERIRALISAAPTQKFDVVVIDGHLRQELVELAFDCLAPRGALLFDNSEGYGFYEETRARSCRRIDFFGFAQGVSLRHCTSLAFVDDCFLLDPAIPIPSPERA